MTKILFYGKRNTGVICLLFLKAKGDINVVVADESDDNVLIVARLVGIKVVNLNLELFTKTFDYLFCVHGTRIFDGDELVKDRFINFHPTHYNGHNPVKKFIKNKDTQGSVRAMYMIDRVDEGELIAEETFKTGVCHEYADYYNIAYIYYINLISKVLGKIL